MRLKINAFYFVLYMSFGIIGPYQALYFSEKGFSGAQIGLLIGIIPILSILLQPVWSALSDFFHTRRLLLVIACLGVTASMVGVGLSDTFTANFLFFMMYSIFLTPISPIGTALVLDYLDEIDKPDNLSLIRVWGSIGFAFSSLVLGSLSMNKHLITFPWVIAGTYIILAVISLVLHESINISAQPEIHKKELFLLAKNSSFMIFLVGMVFVGATVIIANNFQTVFLLSLEASSLLIGIAVALPSLLEIPMMMITPKLLNNENLRWVIITGLALLPIRWGLLYLIQEPGWIIPAQILAALGTISIEIAGVSYIDNIIPLKWRATGQGLFMAATFSIGPGIGNFIAGNILDRYNVRAIWSFNLILGIIGLILVFLALWYFSKPGKGDKDRSGNHARM
jgi:PPP family 3-phenylpropionic acid transporter